MGVIARRRERLAKAVAAELAKANLATAATAAGASTVAVATQPRTTAGSSLGTGGWEQAPMSRLVETFGSPLSPGYPLLPAPLDAPLPGTDRTPPRRYEAPISWNLDLTTRRTPWQILKALADQCDIIHRCIEIRVAEVTGLDWDFTLSDHSISQIMADQGVGHARAAQIGRDEHGTEIDRLKRFFETPLAGYTFAEWMSELLWNHYVLDAVAVYPECNLAGKATGLLLVDGSTIKPLLDNRGMRPRPPAPAYQQILWGFPRGEYQESDPGSVDGEFFDVASPAGRLSDQMAYFVRNRRTWDPYGFSTVEECIPAATLYLGRQRWLNAEYSEGAMPATWLETDEDFGGDAVRLAQFERVINDMLSGNTNERKRNKLLPRGFKPTPMPQIDERYKPEYDEMIIKLIGSKFGVAPTQLGVIPRTGLSGRGQMAGENDQAETMSKKPTEEWLVDVINQICRRFLGSTVEITATFSGGQSAQDALTEAQTDDTKLRGGQTTMNDIRAKNGDPLYDMPEADEPMIVTQQGPVFLKGMLEAQLNPPTPPPVVHMLPPGAPTPKDDPKDGDPAPAKDGKDGEPAEDDGSPDEMAKAAELQAYRKFMSKGARARQFVWHHHTAGEVTDIVKAGGGRPKAPRPPSRPGPGGEREPAIVDHYRPLLSTAVDLGLDPAQIVADYLAVHHPELVTKDVIGTPADQAAIQAWLSTLVLDTDRLRQIIRDLHADAYLSGVKTGLDQLGSAVTVTSDLTDAATTIDWTAWKPGDPQTAGLLEVDEQTGTSGLAQLLARSDVTVNGLTETTIARIGDILAQGVADGAAPASITDALDGYLSDPSRTEMIAVTETNRAMSWGTIDQYQANGVQGFDVVNANPCPLCENIEEDNPHPLGDDPPPYHPRCRCSVAPVLILPDGSEVEEPDSTADLGE